MDYLTTYLDVIKAHPTIFFTTLSLVGPVGLYFDTIPEKPDLEKEGIRTHLLRSLMSHAGAILTVGGAGVLCFILLIIYMHNMLFRKAH